MKKFSVIFCVMLMAAAATSWSQQIVSFHTSMITDVNTEREATGLAGLSAVIDQSSPAIGCGVPVTLTATITGANGISWMRNGEFITGATTDTFIANQSGTYAVVVVSNLCQYESVPVEVVLQSPLNAVVESPSGLSGCDGEAVLLQAGGGTAAWQWTRNGVAIDGAVESVYLAFESGNYAVIGNEGEICASASPEAGVIIHPIPSVSLSWTGDPTVCLGDSLELVASLQEGQQVIYFLDESVISGNAGASFWAELSGVYHGEVTDTLTGCVAFTNSLVLDVLEPQLVAIDVNGPTTFCDGQQVTLSLNQGDGFVQWYQNGAAISSANDVVVTVGTAGFYEARVTDANGCTSQSQPTSIAVYGLPNAAIVSNESTTFLCGVDTLVLQAIPGYSYAWYINDSLVDGANSMDFMVTASGVYSAEITNAEGCTAFSQAIAVSAFDSPVVLLEPSGNINICAGQSQFFDAQASSAGEFTWYLNGDVYSSDFVSVLETAQPGTWIVGVTDDNGCTAMSEPAQLFALDVATPEITLGELSSQGQLLLSDDASGHQWYLNGEMIQGATDSSYLATQEGFYSVISLEDVCQSALSDSVFILLWSVGEQHALLGLYPNPCTDYLVLMPAQLQGQACSIYDLSGNLVWQGSLTNSRVEIDVRSWSVGMYSLVTERGDHALFAVVRQ
jgi:hypothetical protein